jgi:HPt (histidine-containing phosphotransfer) domain-containing protein
MGGNMSDTTREQRVAAAKARMNELAEKFLDRTAGEIDTMRARLAQAGDDPGALAEIRNLAHRASGTGATLGFESLSDCAHRIEMLAAAQPPGSSAEIDLAIEALAQELARQPRASR